MDEHSVKEVLRKGERLTLECKRCENKLPNSLWETYSAFANTAGGLILLGIEEHRDETEPGKRFAIVGVTNPDKLITDFWNLANDPNKVKLILTIEEKSEEGLVEATTEKTPQKIIELINNNANITTSEMANIIGIDRSNIARAIRKLQAEGLIRRVGPDKGGHWEIIK